MTAQDILLPCLPSAEIKSVCHHTWLGYEVFKKSLLALLAPWWPAGQERGRRQLSHLSSEIGVVWKLQLWPALKTLENISHEDSGEQDCM